MEGVDELPHSSDTVDPSGLTKEQELRFLLTAHERFTKFADSRPGVGLAGDELGFARRCVATILRSRGRADYGDPEALKESGGFSLRRSAPDEQVFAADRARFRFSKGEFPAYDQAFSRWEAAFVEGKQIGPITPDLRQGYDALYQEALDVLGVADLNVSLEDK